MLNSSPDAQWTIGTSTLYRVNPSSPITYHDHGVRFFDINGDGLPDFVRSYSAPNSFTGTNVPEVGTASVVLLNTGNGWATSTAYTLPAAIVTAPSSVWAGTFNFNEYGNWNGNGQQNQDVLTTTTNTKGGMTSVTYSPSAQLGTNPELGLSLLVATAVGIYDGLGSAATTSYAYAGGKIYFSQGVLSRKFAGFLTATTTAPDGITATYYDQGDGISSTLGEMSDGFGQINRPFRTDTFELSGTVLDKRILYRWDTQTNGNSTFVGLGRQVTMSYAADGTHRDTATDNLYASTTNDLIKNTDYGEVTANQDGSFTDSGTDKRTTTIVYAASSTVSMTVLVEKTLLDNSNATTTDTKLYYDGLAFGFVSVGNNTKQEDWIAGGTYASSTNVFNVFGLVSTTTDRRGNATGFVYDVFNFFVATTTNALNQTTQYTYNYSNGKTKQTQDTNGRLTRNLYDGVGRILEVAQSDLTTPTTLATSTAYTYTDNAAPPSTVQKSDFLTSTNTVDTFDHFDGLGRLIQERKSSQYASTYSVFDRTYTPAGKLSTQSVPYFSAGSSRTTAANNSLLYTTYTYDALQRVLSASNAVGNTTNVYAKWTTTTTDPNGNAKAYVRDAFGNLAQVLEYASTTQTTTYGYDTQNNLLNTTDAYGNIRNFTYDGLGRRLTAQDLHAPADGTFGTWNYSYDDGGNLVSQTDPKSQVTNRTYDKLSRLLTEDFTGQAGTEVTNTYDTCTKGIGALCTASSTAASSTNIYDVLGRVATSTMTIAGVQYPVGYSYDRQGNVTMVTYPNSSQVSYTYNLAGQPSVITCKYPGTSTFTPFVSNFDYAAHGLVVNTLFANGASTTNAYNQLGLYRLMQLQTMGASSTLVQNFAYLYDPAGNITQIANTASTSAFAITNFSYDQLNRLTVASTSAFSSVTATSAISIADPSVTVRIGSTPGTSDAFAYAVPSGGSNKLIVVMIALGSPVTGLTVTQNGGALTCTYAGILTRAYHYYCYRAAPASGIFAISWTGTSGFQYNVMTLQNAAQTSPIDAVGTTTLTTSGSSLSKSVTTTVGRDLLLDHVVGALDTVHTFGTNQTQTYVGTFGGNPLGKDSQSYKPAGASAGSETMSRSFAPNDNNDDLLVLAAKQLAGSSTPALNPTLYRQSFIYDALGNMLSLGSGATSSPYTTPTILDTLPVTYRTTGSVTSDSFTYTVPSGGTNKLLITQFCIGGGRTPTVTQNGASVSVTQISGTIDRCTHWYGYLANPSTGTFSISWTGGAGSVQYTVMTLANAAQTNPIDASGLTSGTGSVGSLSVNLTTTQANDLLLDEDTSENNTTHTYGAGQVEIHPTIVDHPNGYESGSSKNAQALPATESMTRNFSPSAVSADLAAIAVKGVPQANTAANSSYLYAQTGYTNPDAVTSIGTGLSTTTYTYDNNGNLTQAGLTTYLCDYLNRILSLGFSGSTSTYAYDAMGSRVIQAGTTSTTTYPSKFYSIVSSKSGANTLATSTVYIWNGDTLLGTIDQPLLNGANNGSAQVRYVHPDHLGCEPACNFDPC